MKHRFSWIDQKKISIFMDIYIYISIVGFYKYIEINKKKYQEIFMDILINKKY